jgi:hypothetical protein
MKCGQRRREPQKTLYYRLVAKHLDEFLAANPSLPKFVGNRFEKFLRCGIPEHGCFVFECWFCKTEELIAFSCKQRGVCPSCSNRLMVIGARQMLGCLPGVPYRHWVVSYPLHLSKKLAFKRGAILAAEKAMILEIRKWLESRGPRGGKFGGVVVRHRSGSDLNLVIHMHLILMDGTYEKCEESSDWGFAEGPNIGQEQLDALAAELRTSLTNRLNKMGIQDSATDATSQGNALDREPLAGMASRAGGLHLFVSKPIPRDDRRDLFETCKYLLRGFLEPERLGEEADGTITYTMSTATHKSTRFTPNEFMMAIASLLPRQNAPQSRYIGVLASGSPLRKEILPETLHIGNPEDSQSLQGVPTPKHDRPRLNLGEFLAHTFGQDHLICSTCIYRLQYKGTLYSAAEYRAYRGTIAEPPARAPPGASKQLALFS